MFSNNTKMTLFDACSGDYAYNGLPEEQNGKKMQELYHILYDHLKGFYSGTQNAEYSFKNPANKKHCWISGKIDFKRLGLSWNEAMQTLHAVYGDCPLLFFVDLYKTGGDPNGGYISPVIDAECAREDFRHFYAMKIEEEIKRMTGNVPAGTPCRTAAKKIYDLMKRETRYDELKGSGEKVLYPEVASHSILNYVRERSAVCQGFARTYQAVMNSISIPAVEATVNTADGSHSVNMIFLTDEKKWIMVDVTSGVTNQNDIGFDMPAGFFKRCPNNNSDEYSAYRPAYNYIWKMYLGNK